MKILSSGLTGLSLKTKVCGECGELKTAKEFYRHETNADRLNKNCKVCARKIDKELHELQYNPDYKYDRRYAIDMNHNITQTINRIGENQ